MDYKEEKVTTVGSKTQYVDGLNTLLDKKQAQAARVRAAYARNIFRDPEKYRADLRKLLGWPLVDHEASAPPPVVMEKLSEEDGYAIYRMQFEILDDLTMTGLLFKETDSDPKPLVIVQHGGSGTPEHIAGFYGSTTNYHNMLHRVRQQGVHVFAPQLLLWNEGYNVDYDRKALDARLKRVGSSIAAVEIYGLTKILDYFEVQDYIKCFGMVGLSYGGFYTLYTAAIDTRIRSAISCSFFNTRDAIGWSDWTWTGSAEMLDDPQIACLIYPRKLCIAVGDRDPLFDCRFAVESYEEIKKLCQIVGTDWVDFIVFDGVHEFYKDDAPIRRLVSDLNNP